MFATELSGARLVVSVRHAGRQQALCSGGGAGRRLGGALAALLGSRGPQAPHLGPRAPAAASTSRCQSHSSPIQQNKSVCVTLRYPKISFLRIDRKLAVIGYGAVYKYYSQDSGDSTAIRRLSNNGQSWLNTEQHYIIRTVYSSHKLL